MIKRFLKYVEIMTKITSLFAFLYTIAYLFYIDEPINIKLTVIFFAAMFIFDLTTTAINNYIDTKTNDQKLQFRRRTALVIIYIMFLISASLGLWLAYLTDLVILIIGVFCFFFGIIYTYGPIPISRMPLGEVMSGIFYGLFIPFILMYINMPSGTFLNLTVSTSTIVLQLQIIPLLSILLFSVAPICTTANIMLANNICDLEKDITVKRFTLPYYLGRKALYLFAGIYYLAYLSNILLVVFGILPPLYLLSVLTIIPVQKNISKFLKKQEKQTTFLYAIRNYILIMAVNTLMIFICSL